jgi:hypothetical protein
VPSWASVASQVANDQPRDKWRKLTLFGPPDTTTHMLVIVPGEPLGQSINAYGFVYLSVDADGQEVRYRSRRVPSAASSPSSSGFLLSLAPQSRVAAWSGPWYCNVSLPVWFPSTTIQLFRYVP